MKYRITEYNEPFNEYNKPYNETTDKVHANHANAHD